MDELEEYNCRVPNCDSNQLSNSELYFHSFPNDEPTCELWLSACNITERNKEVLKSYKICEKHFVKSQYSNNYQLVQGCVPNVGETKISELTPVSICTLNNEIKQCISDNNIKKFNVSSSNTKLTHLLLVLNEFKPKLIENIYSFDPPDQNSEQLESINLSTFPIPDELSETLDGSNKLVINKLTETGDEIKITIKSSKRMSTVAKPAPKPITYDFTRICRICLENGMLKNIYEEKIDDIVVDELLKRYTSFMMLETSNLPQDICDKCLNDLTQTHDLFKKIDQSGTIFQNRLRLYPLDSSDMLNYAQKYFSVDETMETPLIQPETQPDLQPDIEPDVQPEVLPEAEEEQDENETLVDLEPDRTIEQIMDIDCIDNIDLESNSDEFVCLKCEESYENFLLLSKHMCGFTPESAAFLSEYNCTFCKTTFKTYNKFSTHLCYVKKTKNQPDATEQKKEYICQVCQEVFPSNSLYLYHRKLYKHDISFYCYECNVNFVTRTAFRKHKRTYQHMNEIKCLHCKQFIKSAKFKAHILEHECFPCKICGVRFFSERKHEKHVLLQHTPRQNVYFPRRNTLPASNQPKPQETIVCTPLPEFPKSFPEWSAPSITNKALPAGTISSNASSSIANKSLPFPGRIISNIKTPLGSKLHSLLTQNNIENISEPIEDLLRIHFPGRLINNGSLPIKNKYKLNIVTMNDSSK